MNVDVIPSSYAPMLPDDNSNEEEGGPSENRKEIVRGFGLSVLFCVVLAGVVVGVLHFSGSASQTFVSIWFPKLTAESGVSSALPTSTLVIPPVVAVDSSAAVPFVPSSISIAPTVAQSFSTSEIANVADMEKAYGVTFTADDLQRLEQNKFVVKNLLDTKISGDGLGVADNGREFVSLYKQVIGPYDYKERTQANALFISSDAMLNLYSILSTDLLKESENKYLYPWQFDMAQKFYKDASDRLQKASSPAEKQQWTKVRNYFAIPYALLSGVVIAPMAQDFQNSGYQNVDAMMAAYQQKDKDADSYENTAAFIKSLHFDAASESKILADLDTLYKASDNAVPTIFADEYQAIQGPIAFKVPFSVFKPRGTYTSSSLRRQYFRAVQWYQQVPFLLSSKDLTSYALDIAQLMHDDESLAKEYASVSSLLDYVIGQGDDYDVATYAGAVAELGGGAQDQNKLSAYLAAHGPQAKIKSLPAFYDSVGGVTTGQVQQATAGMRFISQKFVPDSYWTGQLTQGDEAPAVNGLKLPKMASSLEVMSILGSPYAQAQLPKTTFYNQYQAAIDTRLDALKNETNTWGDAYWKNTSYASTLWTVSGLYDWLEKNRSAAPQFMQSPLWNTKTLITGTAFWTELRHTAILYAKQSFAEKGGGDDYACDTRKVPPPPKGYVEPNPEAYDRLSYMAQRLYAEYDLRGFDLQNLEKLHAYVQLLDVIKEYTKLELQDTTVNEPTMSRHNPGGDTADATCVENFISSDAAITRNDDYNYGGWAASATSTNNYPVSAVSRWEELRRNIVDRMQGILPTPVEGPILPIKDKRTAVVADVHTAGDEGILEEGTGVPRVIFVAVKDANGPRLTVGFTYSQYEFVSPSDRLTDEQWQDNFYTDTGDDSVITYKPKDSWPNITAWYQDLLGTK